ncbi:hypothetical protein CDG61_10575 [Acinetobacter sp. WCHAc010052]|nr:hypothetical protein CDG61_10575 [Acinetobacter sp. WCHAc010052]
MSLKWACCKPKSCQRGSNPHKKIGNTPDFSYFSTIIVAVHQTFAEKMRFRNNSMIFSLYSFPSLFYNCKNKI